MAALASKSLTELRAIAQSLGIALNFADSSAALIQKIEGNTEKYKASDVVPLVVPQTEQDTRLLTAKRPAITTTPEMLTEMMAEARSRGIVLTYPSKDTWHMRYKDREDSGSLRQAPRPIIEAANRLLGAIK